MVVYRVVAVFLVEPVVFLGAAVFFAAVFLDAFFFAAFLGTDFFTVVVFFTVLLRVVVFADLLRVAFLAAAFFFAMKAVLSCCWLWRRLRSNQMRCPAAGWLVTSVQ